MLGREYFERRLGDIFPLSPVPYLCGEGELQDGKGAIKVQWEVCVPITGEPVFAVTSEKIIPPDRWVNADRTFVQGTLTGRMADPPSTVTASGVILSKLSFASGDNRSTYFGHFKQMDIMPDGAGKPTRVEATVRNLTFEALEWTDYGTRKTRDKFHVAVAGRQVYFHLGRQEQDLKNLIEIERIDRALLSDAHVPVAAGETADDGLRILSTLESLLSFLTLNRATAPLLRLLDGDKQAGLRIMDLPSSPYCRDEIVDNYTIPGGLKTCIEAIYDRFVALDGPLRLQQFIDKVLVMHQQKSVEFKLAGLILAFEFFCTSYLTYQGRPPGPETNIQQKLNQINSFLRFIPKALLNDRLRDEIRNPLFHQGVIVGANVMTLWGWYTDYFDLLIDIVFVVLGYTGKYISRQNYAPVSVPTPAASAPVRKP